MFEMKRSNPATRVACTALMAIMSLGIMACLGVNVERNGMRTSQPPLSSTAFANRALERSTATYARPDTLDSPDTVAAAASPAATSVICRRVGAARVQALAAQSSPIDDALAQPFDIMEDSKKRLVPSGAIGKPTKALAWKDDLLYVGHGFGLTILDVSLPEKATRLSTMLLPFEPATFAIGEDVLYVGTIQDWKATATTQRMVLIDVADPTAPILRGRLGGLSGVLDIAVVPGTNRVLVAAREQGLLDVDVADPDAPRIVSRLELDGAVSAVEAVGGHAIVGSSEIGLLRVDRSQPGVPRVVGRTDIPEPNPHLGDEEHLQSISTDPKYPRLALAVYSTQLVIYELEFDGSLTALNAWANLPWINTGAMRDGIAYFGTPHSSLFEMRLMDNGREFQSSERISRSFGLAAYRIVVGDDHVYVYDPACGSLRVVRRSWEEHGDPLANESLIHFISAAEVLPCRAGALLTIQQLNGCGQSQTYDLAVPGRVSLVEVGSWSMETYEDLQRHSHSEASELCVPQDQVRARASSDDGRTEFLVLEDKLGTQFQVLDRRRPMIVRELARWRSPVELQDVAVVGRELFLTTSSAGPEKPELSESHNALPQELLVLNFDEHRRVEGVGVAQLPWAVTELSSCGNNLVIHVGGQTSHSRSLAVLSVVSDRETVLGPTATPGSETAPTRGNFE